MVFRYHTASGEGAHPSSRFLALAFMLLFSAVISPRMGYGETLESLLEKSGYPAAQRERVVSLFDRASGEGIPEDLLSPKLEEGIAKKVPVNRLLHALESEWKLLKNAEQILSASGIPRGRFSQEDRASWSRTANLLATGVAAGVIRRIAEACNQRWSDYRPTTYLYASLMKWGSKQDDALDLVCAAAESSLPSSQFPAVLDLLVRARRQRIKPEEITWRIIDYLKENKSLKELEREVLHE